MQSLIKIKGTYYFSLWIPKDIRRYFPRSEIVKSTHAKKYSHAKGLVRGLLGKAEGLFMVIRSKVLDDSAVVNIVKQFVESTLELTYSSFDDILNDPDYYDMCEWVYSDAKKNVLSAVKTRSEVEGLHVMGFKQGDIRLDLSVSVETKNTLKQLSCYYGVTQRALLNRLLNQDIQAIESLPRGNDIADLSACAAQN